MSKMETDLTQIFQKVFKNNSLKISRELSGKNVSGWDSLKHIQLMTEIEKHFKIRFTTQEILDLKNVGELIDILEKKVP